MTVIEPVGIAPFGPVMVTSLLVKVLGLMALSKATVSDETVVLTSPDGDTEATVGGVVSGTRVNDSEVGGARALPARSATPAPTVTV